MTDYRTPEHKILKQVFRRRLIQWFGRNGRSLPWRRTTDPYKIHVSEIMLQQTQVERVLDYYAPFLRRFPTVRKLARARDTSVVRAWEGLGYYARAGNLHAAARIVVREHAGRYPRTLQDIIALPGIGPSTAGAILSFSFRSPAVVLDTNVARVLRRIFLGESGGNGPMNADLWALAENLLPRAGNIWAYNQGLMDFGATICTAWNPHCDVCCLRDRCRWLMAGESTDITPMRRVAEPSARYGQGKR